MRIVNLYEETVRILGYNNLSIEDIEWVGTTEYTIPLEQFVKLAKETNYNQGYGAQEVATDLIIVGKDWYMDRKEYDGAEWWDFNKKPIKPNTTMNVNTLCITRGESVGWLTLTECNEGEMQ